MGPKRIICISSLATEMKYYAVSLPPRKSRTPIPATLACRTPEIRVISTISRTLTHHVRSRLPSRSGPDSRFDPDQNRPNSTPNRLFSCPIPRTPGAALARPLRGARAATARRERGGCRASARCLPGSHLFRAAAAHEVHSRRLTVPVLRALYAGRQGLPLPRNVQNAKIGTGNRYEDSDSLHDNFPCRCSAAELARAGHGQRTSRGPLANHKQGPLSSQSPQRGPQPAGSHRLRG